LAVFLAIITNNYIRSVSVGKDKFESYNIVQIIYYSNAVTSDGSTDNFVARHYLSDTTYLKYDKKIIAEDELLKELIVQVYNNPTKYFILSKDKTLNYLFHVWPYSWQYPNTQSANNKYYVIFFTFYYIFIIFGLFKLIRKEKYYSFMYISFFVLNFLYHIILIARFRYYLPIVYISIPILYFGFYHFIKYLYYKYFYHNSSINKIYLFVFKYSGTNKL
jgi:hypothetical protein